MHSKLYLPKLMCSMDDTYILVSAYHRREKQGAKWAMKPPTFYNSSMGIGFCLT